MVSHSLVQAKYLLKLVARKRIIVNFIKPDILKNYLFLLVEVDAFELFWDGVADEFDKLWLNGKCVKILCCPQFELCHVVLCLLDVDPLGI